MDSDRLSQVAPSAEAVRASRAVGGVGPRLLRGGRTLLRVGCRPWAEDESSAVPSDFQGTRTTEVPGDEQFPFISRPPENPTATGHCLFRGQAGVAVAAGIKNLHRAVQQISDEDRPVAPGCKSQHGRAGTQETLATIAGRVGYGSPYAISHAFEREFGTTPGRYRAQAAGRSSSATDPQLTSERTN